ncbi:MFS transporter [Cohnella sp.]|uniref:MFS transporter n=1 Tax=Cohnella sp. TaxID=1883426 RepID=UPI003562B415
MKKTTTSKNNGEKLLLVLVFTLIFSVMNATIFNVVMPVISIEFDLSPSQVSWILSSYMIVYAIGSLIFGKLADKYRLKDLLTFGLIFFALGSIVGLAATEYWMVILGRVLQASGASVIPATAMIIPVRYFSQERRGRALGMVATGLALGTALGPIVSGLITGLTGWRFLFCLSLLPLLTLPFFRKYLDDERGQTGKIDFIGGFLLAGTVTLLLLAITQGNGLLLSAGVVLMISFILRIRSAVEPFIQPGLFKNKSYSLGLVIAFLATSLAFGIPFLTPLLLADVNHLSPVTIGLVMFPAAIAAALMGRKGGKLADEKGNPFLVYTATLFIFICYVLLSTFVGVSPFIIMLLLIFGNVGQIFMQIAVINTISRTLSKEQTGVGMGFFSMFNFISAATATSLIGKILDFSSPGFHFNPVPSISATFIYSNIFFVLAFTAVAAGLLYYMQFGSALKKLRNSPN